MSLIKSLRLMLKVSFTRVRPSTYLPFMSNAIQSSRHFIPNLINQGEGGSMINIASIGATRPRPGLVWYNASKAAVANATKGLASEYGPKNIRVNSVCPLLSGTGL